MVEEKIGFSGSIQGRELDVTDKVLLADIGEAVRGLTRNGWRVAIDEVSERRSLNNGGVRHSLKLELRRGPLQLDGC
ncbi:MAG: hypothetical protein LBF78_07115 [Treponema sp.]|jgi:hypothetical protein|nr:hypothetical protein [Treponema sp.]